jgi:hypothetical protein
MNWRATVSLVVGALLALLGGLWLLQGADAVHIRPILCVSNCKPITGESIGWLVAGIVTMLLGVLALVLATRYMHRRAHQRTQQ